MEDKARTIVMNTTSDSVAPACSIFPNDPHKCDVIVGVKAAMASISLIASVFMIFVILLFKKYKSFPQRLVLYLSVASLMKSISYIESDSHSTGHWCNFQALWMTWFNWSCLLWVCCITFNLGLLAIKLKKADGLKIELIYHFICWIIPLILACIPLASSQYGPAGPWCWILDSDWRFGIWYVPLYFIIFLLFFAYSMIMVVVRKRTHVYEGGYDPDVEQSKILMKEDIKPLIGYPLVYLAISIFPLINRIQNAVNHQPIFALWVLHVLSSPLHGAVNAIVFGMDRETMKRLTPTQIKLAFKSHTAGTALIQEYPAEVQTDEEANADAVYPELVEERF